MYEQLVKAIQVLADHCDGAHAEDNMGYNKPDSYLGKRLASATRQGFDISVPDQLDAIAMLQKYRPQLSRYGVEVPSPKEYTVAMPQNMAPRKDSIVIDYDIRNNVLVLKSPYDPTLVQKVRALSGAKWDGANKAWLFPPRTGDALLDALGSREFALTNCARDLMAEPQGPSHQDDVHFKSVSEVRAEQPKPPLTVEITEHQGQYRVQFPYDAKLVEAIKSLPRRKFDPENKSWLVPADSADELRQALGNTNSIWSLDAVTLSDKVEKIRAASTLKDFDIEIPNVSGELMPFQKAGVAFIDQCGGRAIIGDEMGLGKTIQAIGYLALHPELRPAVIVCPASLKPNWRREIEKWLTTTEHIHVLNGTKPYDVPGSTIFIVNYDILHAWEKWLKMLSPAVLICDEAHAVKTPKSRRTKAVQSLAKSSQKVVLMSGTPLLNRPIELFPLLQITRPSEWTNAMAYGKRYCNAHQRNIGRRMVWDFSGASNLRELHDKLRTLMIRRLKSEVLTELPEKRRVVVPMAIDIRKYALFMEETLDALEAAGNQAAQMVIIEKAKQYVFEAKLQQMLEWVENFLESGEKLILFCTHRAAIKAFIDRYPHAVYIDGSSSQIDRENAVEDFQKDPDVELFVGNIKAAGVGLTLTAASNVAFAELEWTPGLLTQAEDRAHRIGQRNSVTAWYLLAEGTVDEQTFELLEKKRTITELVTDGKVAEVGFSESNNVAQDLIDLLIKQRHEQLALPLKESK